MASLKSLLSNVAKHGNRWALDVNRECEAQCTESQRLEWSKERAESITVTKGIAYGQHERHRLDVCSLSILLPVPRSQNAKLIRYTRPSKSRRRHPLWSTYTEAVSQQGILISRNIYTPTSVCLCKWASNYDSF